VCLGDSAHMRMSAFACTCTCVHSADEARARVAKIQHRMHFLGECNFLMCTQLRTHAPPPHTLTPPRTHAHMHVHACTPTHMHMCAVDRRGREFDQATSGRKGAVATAVASASVLSQTTEPLPPSRTDLAPARPLQGSRPAVVPSLVFIKAIKVGGSTMAGVVRRIAAKFGMSGVQAKGQWIDSEPGVWANHGQYAKFPERLGELSGPKFVLAMMRNPLDRCLSAYYHLKSHGKPMTTNSSSI